MSQLASQPTGGALTEVVPQPIVSAILMTQDRESYIRDCLSGLMEQSIANRMEVIVVDQGSQQSEWSVIIDLQRRYQNLIALRVPGCKGGSAGLNLALKLASGRFVTVLEATDRLRNDAYEVLAGALDRRPDAMLSYGDTCFTAIPHESFASHTSYGKMIWPNYTAQQLLQLSLIAPHLMWRRELSDSVGDFDERYESQGMRDFLLRVVDRHPVLHVEEFIGLKLVAAGAPLNQDASEKELGYLKQNHETRDYRPVTAQAPVQIRQDAQAQASARAASAVPQAPIIQPMTAVLAAAGTAPGVAAAPSADQAYPAIQSLLESGARNEAEQALLQHLRRYPDHARAHNDLASILGMQNDTEAALGHYRKAVQLSPQETTYLKNLADLLFVQAGQTDEAIGIYLDLLKRAPRDIETLTNLGIICEAVGQPDEAETFYQRALEIEPWNQGVRTRVTELRARLAQAQAAPATNAASAEQLYEKAQALVAEGDLPGAARELEGILVNNPDFPLAHNDLAVIYYQDGDKDKALFHYEKAAALAPKNTTFQKNLADFYFVEGQDVDGAVAIYLKLLEQEPRNIETLMNLGRICTMLDRPEEATSFFGKVTQLEPWNRDAREYLTTLRQCANG